MGKCNKWHPPGERIGSYLICPIYINDLPSCIHSNVFMFPADTKVLNVIKDENGVQILQLGLVSDSGPPNFRSIRLGPNPKLTITNPKLTLTLTLSPKTYHFCQKLKQFSIIICIAYSLRLFIL